MADADGLLFYLNRSARALLGVGRDEPLGGRHIADAHPDAERRLAIETSIPTAIRDGVWRGETLFRDGSGHEIAVSQVLLAHGRADGRPRFLSSIARDLTKEKRLEAQILQAQKMEAIGRLAGGVAHDFNNLLSVILGSAALASRALPGDHGAQSELREVLRAGERAAELTRRMLAFSRKQVLRLQVVDVNDVLSSMTPMVRRLIGEHIELVTRLAPDAGRIKADPSQLEQVIMNLVVNARDAMPSGGTLTLTTEDAQLDERQALPYPELKPGRYVKIAVRDDGIGMAPAVRARVFEPFFTTKDPGQGTGLGLSMVFGIVKQSGGEVSVWSEPGRGTAFQLYFPCTEERRTPTSRAEPPPVSSVRGHVVLLVEDEAALRKLLGAVLRQCGYDVLIAPGPIEAIELSRRYSHAIDLLLTDVVMPKMNGKELAERITAERPHTRVLYMSGYTEGSIVHQGTVADGVSFLAKPFTPDVLLAAVQRALQVAPTAVAATA